MLAFVNPASVSIQHFVSEGPARKIHLSNKYLCILSPIICIKVSSDDLTLALPHLEACCSELLCPLR